MFILTRYVEHSEANHLARERSFSLVYIRTLYILFFFCVIFLLQSSSSLQSLFCLYWIVSYFFTSSDGISACTLVVSWTISLHFVQYLAIFLPYSADLQFFEVLLYISHVTLILSAWRRGCLGKFVLQFGLLLLFPRGLHIAPFVLWSQ